MSKKHLAISGALCAKLFDGLYTNELIKEFQQDFKIVKRIKPRASNLDNSEFYIVGINYLHGWMSLKNIFAGFFISVRLVYQVFYNFIWMLIYFIQSMWILIHFIQISMCMLNQY